MKKVIITVGVLLGLALTGCDNTPSGSDYKVTCKLEIRQRHDSATLLVLEEDYNKLRVCGAGRLSSDSITFTGQTDKPRVAMIRWDNDSTQPFYFVLEGGDIGITISDGSWSITGSRANNEYQHYINHRNGIMDARVATWQQYLKMGADSTLTRDDEQRMARQDSLLNDSLQRITVERINQGDAVGRIIRERYGAQLDKQHLRQLK